VLPKVMQMVPWVLQYNSCSPTTRSRAVTLLRLFFGIIVSAL